MSGFEVAGVVLGSLPLVISAIEHYADLVQTVKRAIRYKNELKDLKHDLDAELIIFLDTLERVLDGLIPANQLEELLKDPTSTLWQDVTLNRLLQDRLGRSYSVFTGAVDNMNASVQEFIRRLDLNDQGKVRWTESTGLKLALKRAGFSLRKRDFDDLIKRLQKHNRHLKQFTNRSIEFEPLRRKRKQSLKFQKLGDYAKSVFHALEASFGCDCQSSDGHTALFGLAQRSSQSSQSVLQSKLQSSKRQGKIHFQIVISGSFPGNAIPLDEAILWQEMTLESAEESTEAYTQNQISQYPTQSLGSMSTTSSRPATVERKSVRFFQALQTRSSAPLQSNSQTPYTQNTSSAIIPTQSNASTPQSQPSDLYIPSICKLICTSATSIHVDCLGHIADGDRKFLLYPLARSFAPSKKCWSTVSLRQILHDTANSAPPLTPWDRLRLAATLASAVLQLHASPWLESTWNNEDVLFLQREGERLYEQAFVSKQVPTSGKAAIKPSGLPIFNETLLALAIALVELSLGPLESLQTPEDLRAGIYANMVTLWRLVENNEVEIVFGPRNQSAVKRCLELAKISNGLDEQVQQDLYNGVVLVLEDQAARKNSAP
jgi:hypothetical protein